MSSTNYQRKAKLAELYFEVPEDEMNKFRKMYIGVVRQPGTAHMVQERLSMQGFFLIKITPLGANKVLMDEMEEGIIPALISDASSWVYEMFEDIRQWSPDDIDNERAVWVRCHGIPTHAWSYELFHALGRKFGVLLGVDENTRKKTTWTWPGFSYVQRGTMLSTW